jgi:hypothetical protein
VAGAHRRAHPDIHQWLLTVDSACWNAPKP